MFKFQFGHACFERGEASTTFSVYNNIVSVSATHTQLLNRYVDKMSY